MGPVSQKSRNFSLISAKNKREGVISMHTRGPQLETTRIRAKNVTVYYSLCLRFEVKLKRVSFSFAPLSIRGSNGAFGPLYMSMADLMT